MKKYIILILVLIILTNYCFADEFSNNFHKIIHEIKILNNFENNEFNKILGNDLINYRFDYYIFKAVPNIEKNDLKDFGWDYFIKSSNEEVSFRLIFNAKNKKIMKNEALLKHFFKRKIEGLVFHRVNNFDLYQNGLETAEKYLKMIDNNKYNEIYNIFSEKVKPNIDSNKLSNFFKERNITFGEINQRLYHSKNYYTNIPSDNLGLQYYTFNFISNTENIEKVIESLTLIYDENKWRIIGYTMS